MNGAMSDSLRRRTMTLADDRTSRVLHPSSFILPGPLYMCTRRE
ncbi:MAG: hypothetical protein ACXWN1_25070 [Thermoanaerobaculia bacterium]